MAAKAMAAGLVLGWEGEDEEVDIGGSDEDVVPAAALGAQRKRSSSSSVRQEEERVSRAHRRDYGPQKLGMDLKGRDDGGRPRISNGGGKISPSIKGKEPAVAEVGDDDQCLALRKRKLEHSSAACDQKRKKGEDWRSSQWVACVHCKKWRRIPFEPDVERTTWQCRDNVWNSNFATCDIPQEEASTFDNVRTSRVDLPNISDGVRQKGSAASGKPGTAVVKDPACASERVSGRFNDVAEETASAAENGDGRMPPCKMLESAERPTVAGQDITLCQACGVGGDTISCCSTGCKSSYHIRCLVPHPSRQRFCNRCKKKYPEVESIWPLKAGCSAGGEKMYRLKWKGRAHVHNAVFSEPAVLTLAPKKVVSLKKKLVEWQAMWTVPERVFATRKNDSQDIECLVKWTELGYEGSTWECASTGVLAEEKGQLLIKLYDSWCDVARMRAGGLQAEKVAEPYARLTRETPWLQCVSLDDQQLKMLNNLRECWCLRKEGLVLSTSNQEETVPVVSFCISLFREFATQKPILVVISQDMVRFWEKKFREWAPDLNVVMYCGRSGRELIQQYEFALVDNCLKMHVVVCTVDVMISDVEFLGGFNWSAILMHDIRIFAFQNLVKLRSGFRLLFCSDPCKIDAETLHHIATIYGKAGNLSWEELVVCEYKAEHSKVLREYWIPAQMSPVQIHQYCLLLSQSFELLRSGSMCQGDMILNELVSSLRDCCSHPYLVSEPLEKAIEGHVPVEELLNAGIKASGKLDLTHRMLVELRRNRKKVLIIVQMARSKKLINIIDDYLRQQYPNDAYGRIERGMDAQAREAALTRFNSEDSGCFALLLERGAAPTIQNQLTAVDAVFIYDSDWNPWNDSLCLRRLGLNNVVIYRLYSHLTLEEKILDGARHDLTMERPQSVRAIQEMLRWGVAELLQLDDWNMQNNAVTDPRTGWNVALRADVTDKLVFIDDDEVKVLSSGNYGPCPSAKLRTVLSLRDESSKGAPLWGVPLSSCQDGAMTSAEDFWSPLLKDKYVKLLMVQEQRTAEHSAKRKKRKVTSSAGPCEFRTDASDEETLTKSPSASVPPEATATIVQCPDAVPESSGVRLEATETPVPQCSGHATTSSGKTQREEQLERLGGLQSELKLMCELLELPENVVKRALQLLTLVAKHLRLDGKFIHEVELSLCWIAAEELNVSFDKVGAVSIGTGEGFDIDDQSLDAVHEKLQKTLPALSSSTGSQDQPYPDAENIQPVDQVSPHDDGNDSQGFAGERCADGVENVEVLEKHKRQLADERSLRIQRLLNIQKEEWVAYFNKEGKLRERLIGEYEAECRVIQASAAPLARTQLLGEKFRERELKMKELLQALSLEQSELRRIQTEERNVISELFSPRLKQLQNGALPDPLPPDTTAISAESRLRELQKFSANFRLHRRKEADRVVRQSQAAPEGPQEQQTTQEPTAVVTQSEVEAAIPVPLQASPAPLAIRQVSLPVSRTEGEAFPASRREVQVATEASVPGREDGPARTIGFSGASRSPGSILSRPQVPPAPPPSASTLASAARSPDPVAPAPLAHAPPAFAPPGPVPPAPAPEFRASVAPALPAPAPPGPVPPASSLQFSASVAPVPQFPASANESRGQGSTSGAVPQVVRGDASQIIIGLPAVSHSPAALGQGPRHVHQQPVNPVQRPCFDPLQFEESRLERELNKAKKTHEDQVARITKEIEALTRKLDDEHQEFSRTTQAFQSKIQRVTAQRRLAEAYRMKDSASLDAVRIIQGSPSAAAAVWHNSVMDLAAIASSNTRPQAPSSSSSPLALHYNAPHNLVRIVGQLPQQRRTTFYSPPAAAAAAPLPPSANFQHSMSPPANRAAAVAATPSRPTVVATPQELMTSRVTSQIMYENLGMAWLSQSCNTSSNRPGIAPGTGGTLADVMVAADAAQASHPAAVSAAATTRLIGGGGGGGGSGGGGSAFFTQHPLESQARLGHADYICLSDEE